MELSAADARHADLSDPAERFSGRLDGGSGGGGLRGAAWPGAVGGTCPALPANAGYRDGSSPLSHAGDGARLRAGEVDGRRAEPGAASAYGVADRAGRKGKCQPGPSGGTRTPGA